MSYEVVLTVSDPASGKTVADVVVAKRESVREARSAMSSFCGKGWTINRRPDLHSWTDNVNVRIRKWGQS